MPDCEPATCRAAPNPTRVAGYLGALVVVPVTLGFLLVAVYAVLLPPVWKVAVHVTFWVVAWWALHRMVCRVLAPARGGR